MLTTTRLDYLALAVTAGVIGASAMLPLPRMADLLDRPAMAAWSASLDRELGPAVADCVRYEMLGHLSPRDLDRMLAASGGDPGRDAVLRAYMTEALGRCHRRHPVE